MSYGGQKPPFRTPCDGSVTACFTGPRYQHKLPPEPSWWKNVTKVVDTNRDADNNPVSGAGVDPYTRQLNDVNPCTSTVPDCGPQANENKEFCGAWGYGDDIITGNTVDKNAYELQSTPKQTTDCRMRGFQNILVQRQWHGMPGFQSHDPGGCTSPLGDDCGDCSFEAEQTSADQTRYLTIHRKVTMTFTRNSDSLLMGEYLFEFTTTVNANSGEITKSGCTMFAHERGGDDIFLDPYTAAQIGNFASTQPNSDIARLAALFDLGVQNCGTAFQSRPDSTGNLEFCNTIADRYLNGATADEVFSGSISNTSLSANYSVGSTSDFTNVITFLAELSDANPASAVVSDGDTLRATWNWDDYNQYPPRNDGRLTQAPMVSRNENGEARPNIPWSPLCQVDDLRDPINDADGHAPFAVGWLPTYGQMDWFDPGSYRWIFPPGQDSSTAAAVALRLQFDGSIVGAPLAYTPDKHFDFSHVVVDRCLKPSFGWVTFVYGFGAYNPANGGAFAKEFNPHFPARATRWTNLQDEADNIPGKYKRWVGGVFTMQDYRETKEDLASQDFARPYGKDRWMFDELNTGCITGIASNTITVALRSGGAPAIVAGNKVIINSGTFDSGLYPVTGVSGNDITVGTKICDLPADFEIAGETIGLARFPDCPSFGGTIAVTACAQNVDMVTADITLSTAANYLRTGDSLAITGLNIPSTTYTVTVLDSTHIQVTAAVTGSYVSGGTIACIGCTPHDAPAEWVDDRTKGDYFIAEWSGSLRDYQERDRVIAQYAACESCGDAAPGDSTVIRPYQADNGMPRWVTSFTVTAKCLALQPCHPQWMEMPAFPGSFPADARYGALWQAMPYQSMQDLFFQTPHPDCAAYAGAGSSYGGFQWVVDAGACVANVGTIFYYALPRYVEARLTVPSGAPSLPAGVVIGVAPLSDLQLAVPVSGLPATPPPSAPGFLDAGIGPLPVAIWILVQQMCGCIGSGAFSAEYASYDLPC